MGKKLFGDSTFLLKSKFYKHTYHIVGQCVNYMTYNDGFSFMPNDMSKLLRYFFFII